jgi:hypothetical protein
MYDNFDNRITTILSESPLVIGDNVCMAAGWLWTLKRKKDYEKQLGPVPNWVLNLHIHLRCDLCRIALEEGRPLPLLN